MNRLLLIAITALALVLVACHSPQRSPMPAPEAAMAVVEDGKIVITGDHFFQVQSGSGFPTNLTLEVCGIQIEATIVNGEAQTITLPPANAVRIESGTTITADIPDNLTDNNIITITNPDGQTTTIETSFCSSPPVQDDAVSGIAIDGPGNRILLIGGTSTLEVTLHTTGSPDTSVTWKSNNENVATISQDGLLTAVDAGTTTISATSVFDTTQTAQTTVTIVPSVTGITLTPGAVYLSPSNPTALITATVDEATGSYTAITWISSDENIATVDQDGLVTAHQAGEARITATSDFDTDVRAEATVVVFAITEPASDKFFVGATMDLKASATNNPVVWSSSDETRATVRQDGGVTAVGAGTVDITATATINGTSISDTVTVEVIGLPTTDPMVIHIDLNNTQEVTDGYRFDLNIQGNGTVYVDWGDGQIQEFKDPSDVNRMQHIYNQDNSHTVKLIGTLAAASFFEGEYNYHARALTAIHSWGQIQFDSFANAFTEATNLVVVPGEIPSTVLSLSGMFQNAASFNQDISGWNTRNVEAMDRMFSGANSFYQDVSGWCVVKIRAAPNNFAAAHSPFELNVAFHPLWGSCPPPDGAFVMEIEVGPWNLENGKYPFDLNITGNGAVIVDWGDGTEPEDIPDARSRNSMKHEYTEAGTYTIAVVGTLTDARFYDNYLSGLNFSPVTAVHDWGQFELTSLHGAFRNAHKLTTVPKELPNTVTSLESTFEDAWIFNQDLSGWETSAVTSMSATFAGARDFNQDISGWDTSSVNTMSNMFIAASSFNQDLNDWNTGSVTDMGSMFRNAYVFEGDISGWDTSSVRSMGSMFQSTLRFNTDISSWNTGSVTSMNYMFDRTNTFNQDIGDWDTGNVETMTNMFHLARKFDQDLSAWCVSKIVTEPDNFSLGSVLSGGNRPVWGTCPI